jgi:CDP-diacylglycerol--glycerol-3-phosphate 3-phosphatidyltransferase
LELPNTLTWLRILMIPAILVLFYLPYWWKDPAACAAFALAGITDSLDGYYARKLGPNLAPRRVLGSGRR